MGLESDRCRFLAGVRLGVTIGSPIAILVENLDHENWLSTMNPNPITPGDETPDGSAVPRPGHADFSGMLKFGHSELRPVLERASARETVSRVAAGAVCRRLLAELGVTIRGRVVSLGAVTCGADEEVYAEPQRIDWDAVESSRVGCEKRAESDMMCAAIDEARDIGESLGGVFEVWAWGVCPGLGDGTRFKRRLDGRVMAAMGGIPAVKGVEIGPAFKNASRVGSMVHDAFVVGRQQKRRAVRRSSNRAGGIEGGMSNGMPIVVRCAMKPIPTLTHPLDSVDLNTLEEASAHVERSDVTAVPSARVVGEAMMALVLAEVYLDKFGGDSLAEIVERVDLYWSDLQERGLWHRS